MYALVDAKIASKVKKHSWNMRSRYVVRSDGITLHHFVMEHQMKIVVLQGEIDHVDRNPLNNTSVNLRVVTRKENLQNTKIRRDNKSGYKGVSRYKTHKWTAKASNGNGKQLHLGYFNTAKEAAIAYNKHLKTRTDIRECLKTYNTIN